MARFLVAVSRVGVAFRLKSPTRHVLLSLMNSAESLASARGARAGSVSPIPDHISGRPEDITSLTTGLIAFDHSAKNDLDLCQCGRP
ncbi:hypothetical protein LMTR13_23865 [Bradyrhizobium icense]|uniref:Uncharacterized protein n=1 Tax=Bradyrhizobium icense TaxID=1274631 RepID=A0A1B1UJ23_9BRAD|nr:hypothetical protein LMTR13_23865 [Bradyrhizobium icense]